MGSSGKKPWASLAPRGEKKAPVGKEAAPSADPAAIRDASNTLSPYHRGDPIPKPDAVEKDTDTTWALWSDLEAAGDRAFADTVPPTQPMRYSAEERSFAATVPGAAPGSPDPDWLEPRRAPASRELSITDVMVEARKNNRVCPLPARWQQLYDMLPGKTRSSAGWQPPPPLLGAAWNDTPSIPKRMCFREHLEWAETHGCLQQVFSLMKSLPEHEWYHMGEKVPGLPDA